MTPNDIAKLILEEDKNKPQFSHDCETCQFLDSDDSYDYYVCPTDLLGPTVVARYGSEGPEYASMPMSIISDMIKNGNLPEPFRTANALFTKHCKSN